MATLAEIRAFIGTALQDATFQSVSSASVDAAINAAISYYKNRRFWFNEDVAYIPLTIGNPVVPSVPADFLEELEEGGLSITYSNINYPIYKRSSPLYDMENFQGNGIPYIYTFRNQQFELYYYPQEAYTLTLRYLKDYVTLAGDSSTNDFTLYGDMMIKYNALSRIYAELKQDDKMEAYYSARADDEETNLKRRSSSLTGTGKLTLYSNFLN